MIASLVSCFFHSARARDSVVPRISIRESRKIKKKGRNQFLNVKLIKKNLDVMTQQTELEAEREKENNDRKNINLKNKMAATRRR
jgi:hypothetical protein